ncbi:TetR/AcrR family transcriptional regulator [Marinifilum caeruleilacunae]|uniref:TetR/AcrR family transcriptional regulator n=1 Tax=Marinifilum caeruleilacunae TaxID=2499076 RepID=A0ABX1X152_9BACT|nr:TetR/AcrR family transcriptional regulator [Marinifilum caeruleilacunae]NOU62126.1 TetR/AcrR family transcriptional regulator [Marinifilum caeruleilacunae]
MKIDNADIKRIVFESAQNILLRRGLKGWNMNDLANECGMAKGTLYKIIGNKEDLLYRCYEDTFKTNLRSIRKYVNLEAEYSELLVGLATQIIGVVDEFVFVASKNIRTEYPRISQMIDDNIKEYHNLIIAFFEKGIQQNKLKVNADAHLIIGIIDSLINSNLMNCKDVIEYEAKTEQQLSFLFEVIKK